MKVALVLMASFTFAFGGVVKDRNDPCSFFGICNDSNTTMAQISAKIKVEVELHYPLLCENGVERKYKSNCKT